MAHGYPWSLSQRGNRQRRRLQQRADHELEERPPRKLPDMNSDICRQKRSTHQRDGTRGENKVIDRVNVTKVSE